MTQSPPCDCYGRLSRSQFYWLFFPTYWPFRLLSHLSSGLLLALHVYEIDGWPSPESLDDRIDVALPNILTGASFSSHLLPVFSSLFTTLKNDSWHPLESSVSRIDNPQSSIKTKQPLDHHMGVMTCWIGYWIQSTFAFKLMRTQGKRCIMHEIHGSCFPETVWPRTMIEEELGLL